MACISCPSQCWHGWTTEFIINTPLQCTCWSARAPDSGQWLLTPDVKYTHIGMSSVFLEGISTPGSTGDKLQGWRRHNSVSLGDKGRRYCISVGGRWQRRGTCVSSMQSRTSWHRDDRYTRTSHHPATVTRDRHTQVTSIRVRRAPPHPIPTPFKPTSTPPLPSSMKTTHLEHVFNKITVIKTL